MEDNERESALKQNRSPKTGFVTSRQIRPEILDRILQPEQFFLDDGQELPVEPVTDSGSATDIGHVPNYAVGELKDQPKTAEEILGEGNPATSDKSKKALLTEAVDLGLEVTGKESGEQLKKMIKAFAGQ